MLMIVDCFVYSFDKLSITSQMRRSSELEPDARVRPLGMLMSRLLRSQT